MRSIQLNGAELGGSLGKNRRDPSILFSSRQKTILRLFLSFLLYIFPPSHPPPLPSSLFPLPSPTLLFNVSDCVHLSIINCICHSFAILLPFSCHSLAILLPFSCHSLAILLPFLAGSFFFIFISFFLLLLLLLPSFFFFLFLSFF